LSDQTAFRARVRKAVADERAVRAVHAATWHKVDGRRQALQQLRDAEALRELAGQIKRHTLERLPDYLEQFVTQVRRRGGRVHFAADANAARRIIREIAAASGARLVVKAKSMTTEEIDLNEALEAAGTRVVETDLGEFIVQIDHDRPSHIVTPIIHKDRQQVARAMVREIGCEYTEDAKELTAIARRHLRDIFRRCDLGITGVNFAVAETGTLCICTNEGNGRMTVTRPRVHVAVMGIEKLIPRANDLGVFLKLLARSSTAQPLTIYTTLISGPRQADDPDGPQELHVVLLDNGRSNLLGGEFEEVLRCIRCGACLNACPVYRSIGGHAYGSVYPGPIGALVTPLLQGLREHAELPRASSLCGACQIACPVKIDIPALLVRLRARTESSQPLLKRLAIHLWKWVMKSPTRYQWGQWWLPRVLSDRGDGWTRGGPGPLGAWTHSRDLPIPPKQSFRRLWRERLSDER
jgi:L-lactate dehydrogenase complex protein LldF